MAELFAGAVKPPLELSFSNTLFDLDEMKFTASSASTLAASRRSAGPRLWVWALLMTGLLATVYGVWSWRQWTRPGMRHYLKGMELSDAKRYVDAEQEWLRGVREDPQSPECHERLGDLYFAVRQFPDAARFYQSAGKLQPNDGELFLKLTKTQQSLGDLKQAYAASKQAALLMPENAEAVGEYGVYAAHFKNRVAAAEALRKAHSLLPDNDHYLIALVLLELDASNWKTAEEHLRPFLQRHPDHTEANYYMGVIYNQKPRTKENLDAALRYVQRSVAKDKHEIRTSLLLGQLYLDSNQPKAALRTYLDGIARWPNLVPLHSGLEQCYTRLGDAAKQQQVAHRIQLLTARQDRMEYLKHALGFNTRDIKISLELALLYEQEKNFLSARGCYELALKAAPKDPLVQQRVRAFFNRAAIVANQAARKPASPLPPKH